MATTFEPLKPRPLGDDLLKAQANVYQQPIDLKYDDGSNRPETKYLCVSIGGGATGITAAHWLQKRIGTTDFVIFERNNALGGTWINNVYAGAGVDVNVFLYSMSYAPKHDWSTTFAKQPENVRYMQQVAAELNVNPFVCFNTEVLSLTWDEPNSSWVIRIRHLPTGVENNVRADFVILGAGPLSLPKMPKIQGIEKFQGRQCHTAQWDQGLVLDGKKVVLVGTGASGLQVVEAITDKVKELTIFQQSPSWVVPRNATVLTSRMKWALKNIPLFAKLMRAYVFLLYDTSGFALRKLDGPTQPNRLNLQVRDQMLAWYATQVKDPVLLEKVTPSFPFGCHRVLPADLYFSCIQKPHVTFLDASHPGEALASVDETGVNTSGGKHIDADVIIYATGFHVHKYLRGLSIKGRDGKDIQDLWADEEPKNWMGITVAGFPNLFISLGPRGLLGYQSAIFSVECQVEYAIESIKQCLKYGYKTIEVTQKAQEEFIDWYDKKMSQLLWSAPIKGCGSYYKNDFGKSVAFFPGSGSLYYWMCRKVDWSKVKVTPGRSKTWFFSWSDTAKYALFLAVLAYAWKKYGKK